MSHIEYTLHCGPWERALGDSTWDSLITDPPYSSRVATGYRSGSDIKNAMPHITYGTLSEVGITYAVDALLPRTKQWAVVWCDHELWPVWHRAFGRHGWKTFAPVAWVKTNAPPRFAGDGPTCSVEYLCVARPRGWPVKRGSRPGHYQVPRLHTSEKLGIVGQKPFLQTLRVVDDYSSPGDTICDPYAGSGTTLEAALCAGCNAIGFEANPSTHKKAADRLSKAFAKIEGRQDDV